MGGNGFGCLKSCEDKPSARLEKPMSELRCGKKGKGGSGGSENDSGATGPAIYGDEIARAFGGSRKSLGH